MIIAVQAGDIDRDPAQTYRYALEFLGGIASEGDSLLYVSQPTTMMDQVAIAAGDLGLDVTKVTPDFMAHGAEAVTYSLETIVRRADTHAILQGTNDALRMDLEFLSIATYYGKKLLREVVPYERIEVL